jgi:hypothetical protein
MESNVKYFEEGTNSANILYIDKSNDEPFAPMVSEENGLISMSASGYGFTLSIQEWVWIAHSSYPKPTS